MRTGFRSGVDVGVGVGVDVGMGEKVGGRVASGMVVLVERCAIIDWFRCWLNTVTNIIDAQQRQLCASVLASSGQIANQSHQGVAFSNNDDCCVVGCI